MLQHLPQLSLVVGFLVAFVASFSRIFAASKPFWSGRSAWFQMLAPQIALALGALGAGLAGGITSWTDLTVVFVGAGALLLPGLPSNRSTAPLPSTKNPVKVPPLVGLMLCLFALCLAGCNWLESKAPAVEACAPTPAALAAQVAAILADGGDYKSKLEALFVTDTEAAVVCAVQAFLSAKSTNVGAEDSQAKARGQAFLAEHPVGQ